MNPVIEVVIELEGEPLVVGTLWTRRKQGREGASFAYSEQWLQHPQRFALEPALQLGPGVMHTPGNKALFGALGDSAPDTWGRVLIRRAERQAALDEQRTPRTLGEADYLLGVCDEARQGALRFRFGADGPYQAPSGPHAVPPLVDLPRLLSSSERVSRGDADSEDLRLLLAPGSSMGGARPKACIRDRSGELVLAKFPRNSDEIDVVRWEAVALKLAQRAGVPVPPHRLELVAGRAVLLVSRFDRRGAARVPFLSAMSMLGAVDNEPHSYLEIADALRLYGAQPRHDLQQLWRRIVFGVLINNTDDHLRNHGFLYQAANGWVLSPAYDLNPMPVDLAPRALTTAIDLDDPTASLKLVLSTADDYGLSKERGVAVIEEVAAALEGWVAVAKACGLNSSQIERMRSAFEHPERML